MENYSVFLPSYSIGTDVYSKIPGICRPYGMKIAAIGGHKAMAAAKDAILKAIDGTDLEVLEWIWFGGESSYENIELLKAHPVVQAADMIFGIGGGKATDTAKCLADQIGKPIFSFPTIASNCSATTSVSIMYHPDGSFMKPHFFERPPVHAFIQTSVIAGSPDRYMWAGIGDTYAKYFESSISSRGESLEHYVALGVGMSSLCYEPLMQYGEQALKDLKAGIPSYAFEQTLLSIIVTTGIVSNLVTKEHIIDYNTGLAHAVYYALTSFPHIEEGHLHGELVGFGVLLLLLIDGQQENFERVYSFNEAVKLPTCLADVEITEKDLDAVVKQTVSMKDIDHNPYVITEDMVSAAIEKLMAYHDSRKA